MLAVSSIKDLEQHSLTTRFLRLFIVPLLNLLSPRIVRLAMRNTSRDAATVVAHGGSTIALEAMYTRYHRHPFERGIIQGIADFFWHHVVSQPKALRNRLRIVEFLVEEEILRQANSKATVEILNVAGGSSRAIIHTLSRLKHAGKLPPILVTNIDRDPRAIALGKKIAKEFGCSESFRWVAGNVRSVSDLVGEKQYDIVEVVGFLDYLSDEDAKEFLEQLRQHTKEGGTLIAANIMPNSEKPFIHKTGWPRMYYRQGNRLTELLAAAGFQAECDTLIEPLHVHAIVRVHPG